MGRKIWWTKSRHRGAAGNKAVQKVKQSQISPENQRPMKVELLQEKKKSVQDGNSPEVVVFLYIILTYSSCNRSHLIIQQKI